MTFEIFSVFTIFPPTDHCRPLHPARQSRYAGPTSALLDSTRPVTDLVTMNASLKSPVFPATIPEDFERSIEMTRGELDHHLRLMAALKMFELGQISTGKAAELIGISRVDFLQTCGRYRVSVFNYPPDEIEAELQSELRAFSN